jgi:xanthine dehydrogenase accessory factor
VGAGHIAVPLAELGTRLGFSVTVLDDREEFATAERFAPEVRVMRSDFAIDPFAGVHIDGRTYVALVTRGHRWDFDCLQRLVAAAVRPRYVGMIGSRRRVRAALQALLRAGVARDVLATVRAPIGLEIGAETPAEIAVSITAEMIAVRHGVDVQSITARERVLERLLPEED